MAGGSYLVARRIRMHIEVWDRTPLREQEDIFGRTKRTGAAYGQTGEFDAADFERQRTAGGPLIPATAHIRWRRPTSSAECGSCAAGYNYTDGSDGVGHLDAGLFFVAFMRDPGKQFVPMQRSLARLGRPQRVHRAHRVRGLRLPTGSEPRTELGRGALRMMRGV